MGGAGRWSARGGKAKHRECSELSITCDLLSQSPLGSPRLTLNALVSASLTYMKEPNPDFQWAQAPTVPHNIPSLNIYTTF